MSLRIYLFCLLCALLFSCNFSKDEYGRVIPLDERKTRTKNINNKIIEFDLNEYNKEIIYSNDGNYIFEIYTHNKIYKLNKYSDEYQNIFVNALLNKDKREYFYSILNIKRNEDVIINGFFINPDDKILLNNDKAYCHLDNTIIEIDLINITETVIYGYGKFLDVEINKIRGNYLIITINGYTYIPASNNEPKKINKKVRIKI